MYGKSMEIFFSAEECNPTRTAGVAIILNKNLIQTEGVVMTDLIPGQALLVQIPWHGGTYFNWLAIYAPNDDSESKLILPTHEDQRATVEAFTNFQRKMNLRDGWRNADPDTKDFTFMQMAGNFSRSRIDRIYVSDLNERQTEDTNLQIIYVEGKKRMIWILQQYAKCSIPVKKARMEQLQAELDAILQDDKTDEDSRLLSAAILQQKIQQIRREINEGCQTSNMIRAKLEMKTISKYWLRIGNTQKPCDTIHRLWKLGSHPPEYLDRSDKMAEEACKFYNELQDEETFPEMTHEEKLQATGIVPENITARPQPDEAHILAEALKYEI
ncbi:hypothetical protein EDD18DRAFT_1106495 [Armillaria luteobubalina]|uniref:Uncharacterized protein n=1 Tax=Armillaria luteobubalina TaxID=153913 RepID=A0AA39UN95_9AGAR|nr:hypothetical protein EDD18DRAFT_1106495 [Armillaria luteobubalina]